MDKANKSEAMELAMEMGSDTADAMSLVADLVDEFPFVGPILKTLKALRDTADTVTSNREELAALQERCAYLTACAIAEQRRRHSSSEIIDVSPLVEVVNDVERLAERCGRRGRFQRVMKAGRDKGAMDALHRRLGALTGDMGLAGTVVVEGKVDHITKLMVSQCHWTVWSYVINKTCYHIYGSFSSSCGIQRAR